MTPQNNEWHAPIPAEDITATRQHYEIEADSHAREALARRLDVESVDAAHADFDIHRDQAGYRIVVAGRLQAEITQKCVVTLDPVRSHIDELFDAYFADTETVIPFAKARKQAVAEPEEASGVETPMVEEHEAPEPLDKNGCVDLGELAAQYLSLGMPSYPKKEGARHAHTDEDVESGWEPASSRRNPFAALKNRHQHSDADADGDES